MPAATATRSSPYPDSLILTYRHLRFTCVCRQTDELVEAFSSAFQVRGNSPGRPSERQCRVASKSRRTTIQSNLSSEQGMMGRDCLPLAIDVEFLDLPGLQIHRFA